MFCFHNRFYYSIISQILEIIQFNFIEPLLFMITFLQNSQFDLIIPPINMDIN